MDADNIDVSIIFATKDREEQLQRTLEAYRELNTKGIGWELIVIDNNSRDGSRQILQKAAGELPLMHLSVPEPGQNRARNNALAALQGDLVVFTDDDALIDPECLQAFVGAAGRWPDEAIFGARIDPEFPVNTPEWLKDPHFKYSSTMFGRYVPAASEGPVKRHPYGPGFAVRRDALGGHRFDEKLGPQSGSYAVGGEGEFLRRIASDKYRFIYVPDARVRHVVRPDQIKPDWLFSRAHKKGRGQVYMPNSGKRGRIQFYGVPLKLLFAMGRSSVRYNLCRILGMRRSWVLYRIQFELRYGQVCELWAQHRRNA